MFYFYKYKKNISIIFFIICLIFVLSGCTVCENSDDYYTEQIDELESRVSELESENEELKDKLDNIQTMSSERNYNYKYLLDDIEDESFY